MTSAVQPNPVRPTLVRQPADSSRDRRQRTLRHLMAVPLLALLIAMSACASTPPDTPTASGTSTTDTSTTDTPATKADCSPDAILQALPASATMIKFDCATAGDTEWAAAQVDPGNTAFFLQWNGTSWDAEDSDSICGTASAGLPQKLLTYCQAPSATTSPSASATSSATPTSIKPVTAPCTSAAILAALPNGSSMEKFTCADVSGTTWAAARVSPGATVFFLQWNGTSWDAEDSDSICGTASAGLPEKLLAYCR